VTVRHDGTYCKRIFEQYLDGLKEKHPAQGRWGWCVAEIPSS